MFDVRHVAEEPGLLQPERQAVLRHPRQARGAQQPARAQPRAGYSAPVSFLFCHQF